MFGLYRQPVALLATAIAVLSIAIAGCGAKPDPPVKPAMAAGGVQYPHGMQLGADGKPVRRGP